MVGVATGGDHMYFLVKRYFVPEPIWFRSPHWDPIAYATWQEVRDAYIQERLSNILALGKSGYPAVDINIEYVPDSI